MVDRNLDRLCRAVAVLLLLGGCAGTTPQPSKGAADSSAVAPGVHLVSPRVAEAKPGTATPFPTLPSGYRGLGGAFMNQGSLVVVTPDLNERMQKHDLDVALMHSMAAGRTYASLAVQRADCQGDGDTPTTTNKKTKQAKTADEVSAGIACAK